MRLLTATLFAFFTTVTLAFAQHDSVFESYDGYASYVDSHVMKRDFVEIILRLGGRGEYTPEELAVKEKQFGYVWPKDFTHSGVFRREDLGGGVSQEARIYWTGTQYAFFYALLHARKDGLVVLTFSVNNNAKPIIARF